MKEGNLRTVVASMNVALDGVMEAPDRWFFPFWSEELSRSAHEELLASDVLLFGRVTYEEFAEFWPTATNEPEIAERMNGLPKYVASTTLTEPLAWNGTTLIKGDVPEAVARLKEQPGGQGGSPDVRYRRRDDDQGCGRHGRGGLRR
jgi:dihydrofolate reductase